MGEKIVWTIGHSTRSIEELLLLLKSFQIESVADIRSYPGSRRYPHFNKENLEALLPEAGLTYKHMKELGGRRKPRPDSVNRGWRNEAFKGYADYMETEDFKKSLIELEQMALNSKTAFMCSEALWWKCHRSMVADYLKVNNWRVMHIMGINKAEEHPFTSPARIVEGRLSYQKIDNTSSLQLEL